MEHMRDGKKHTKRGGLFRRKAANKDYDFGWGFAWRWGFLIGGILFLALSVGTLVINKSLFILSGLLFLIALQLFTGDLALQHVHKIDAELVLPYVNWLTSDGNLVLDAGCGSGRTSIPVSKILKHGKIIAVDKFDAPYIGGGGRRLLEQNLKVANIQDKVNIQAHDLTNLTFEDDIFDAAISTYVLDHMGDDQLKGLKEINRVLKQKGKLLMMIMLPNYFTIMIFSFISVLQLTSRKKWNQLIMEANFKCIDDGDINGGHYFLLEKAA
jgi:ubiquinone/menaquinone biosynthesis C-methylase UbiE